MTLWDEGYANIKMPDCPECGVMPTKADLSPGRWTADATARLSCGHTLVGDAAREFRAGIPDHYKVQP